MQSLKFDLPSNALLANTKGVSNVVEGIFSSPDAKLVHIPGTNNKKLRLRLDIVWEIVNDDEPSLSMLPAVFMQPDSIMKPESVIKLDSLAPETLMKPGPTYPHDAMLTPVTGTQPNIYLQNNEGRPSSYMKEQSTLPENIYLQSAQNSKLCTIANFEPRTTKILENNLSPSDKDIRKYFEKFYTAFKGFEKDFASFSHYCNQDAIIVPCSLYQYPEATTTILELVGILDAILRSILQKCETGFGHIWVAEFNKLVAVSGGQRPQIIIDNSKGYMTSVSHQDKLVLDKFIILDNYEQNNPKTMIEGKSGLSQAPTPSLLPPSAIYSETSTISSVKYQFPLPQSTVSASTVQQGTKADLSVNQRGLVSTCKNTFYIFWTA